MKLKQNLTRITAGALALGLTALLAGCGATADTTATAESAAASSEAASETATDEAADAVEDAYAYLASFTYSDAFDDNGYVTGVKASDYVTLADDYLDIVVSEESNTVSSEDVLDYINTNILANYQTSAANTERAAEDGDSVNIDYSGSIDGEVFEGGTATGSDLVLGSGSFIDGFEEQIVGHTPGETFNVEVTFPEDYRATDLAGKAAVFVTTLNHINETVTPELTDEWVAENLGEAMNLNSVQQLNDYVSDTMIFDQQANEIYGQLVEKATFAEEYPETLVNYFEDWYLMNPYQYAQMYGVDLDSFLAQAGYTDAATYLESAQSSIESSVRQVLLMQAVAEALEIVCDTETMNAEFERFFNTTDPTEYISNYGEGYMKMNILHDLVLESYISET